MTPQEVQQYIEAVTKGLAPLGEKVATGAKEYYALAYRQSILDGIEALVVSAVFLIVLQRIWVSYKRAKLEAGDGYWENGVSWVMGLCFSTLILGVASLVLVCVAIDHIGNPGYQAIRNMLTPITGGRQ